MFERIRAALHHRRYLPQLRVLLLDSSYYIVRDVREAAEALGHQVLALPVKARGQGEDGFIAAFLQAVLQLQPDFLLTLNLAGFDGQGVLARICAELRLPVATWFVDHPALTLGEFRFPEEAREHLQAFCLERTADATLLGAGFPDVRYLPTAASGRWFHPSQVSAERAARHEAPLSFVGHSWYDYARVGVPGEVAAAAAALITEPLDLAAILRARPAPAVLQVALAEAALRRRVRLLRALLPLGLRVYGDEHWRSLLARGAAAGDPPDLDLRPEVDPYEELPAVYAGSAINVNSTAPQLPTGVNQRLWEVPAAGGFLLTDAQEDALSYFHEGQELAVYRSPEEALDKARYYGARPELRRRMSAAALVQVERHHRYSHRFRAIEQTMRARFAPRGAHPG